MTYNINTAVFGNTFAVPCDVADKYIKIATHTQLKVLLFFMRNISSGIDSQKISQALSLPINEVEDAIIFWQQCGIVVSKQEPQEKNVIINSQMPSRADVIKRGLEDERLMFLLREAQLKFGRNLKQNESSLIVSLYDDHGMDASVILLLLQYASHEGKCNISFVKKTATLWLNQGVENVADAERIISDLARQDLAWNVVRTAFGIEKRNPGTKEAELANLWINEWNISVELLKSAYDVCVDTKSKLSIPYIAKIIETWHQKGITSPRQIPQKSSTQKSTKNDYAGYDLDLFEKMLNKD